ncbi:MAG: choice-of-anchor I family protein [bacterium]|nr:choice-of-anchor I family protein [bacterium]
MKIKLLQTMLFLSAIFGLRENAFSQIQAQLLGRYTIGTYNSNGGVAEISAYDPSTKRMYVVNGPDTSFRIVNLANPANPTLISTISVKPYGIDVTSIATNKKGLIAIAVIDSNGKTNASSIVFLDANGSFISKVKAGANTDHIIFTPNGNRLLCANEGEPNVGYTIDPEGSVTIINVSGGAASLTQANVQTAGFTSYNGTTLDAKIRIFGRIQTAGGAFLRNSTVAEDLEPEYIAISDDNTTAWVTCQENNCMAVLNINTGTITSLIPFGFKNHNLPGNGLDPSDRSLNNTSALASIANWPVFGMYMPDGISSYRVGSQTYLVTANEGDARGDWGSANNEEVRVNDATYILDTVKFGGASAVAALKANGALGRLNVTNRYGDFNNDGKFDSIFTFGARSFTIWNGTTGALVWDSKDDFEQRTLAMFPANFNCGHTTNSLDDRSDNKGPEPESVTIGKILDSTYAFVGLERIGGIMIYNITNPLSPYFVQYINSRNFSVTPGQANLATVGDLGPEGIAFIPRNESPNGKDLVLLSNEVSGTVAIYQINSRSAFQMQVLHASDMESGVDAPIDAPNFAAVLDTLEGTYANTVKLASGDCFIPSPFLSAGEDPSMATPLRNTASSYYPGTTSGLRAAIGRTDVAMMNIMGFQGSAFGNHEFDLGTPEVNSIIGVDIRSNGADKRWVGAQFPYLSANLNFANDINLSYLTTTQRLSVDSFKTSAGITANSQKKGIAPSAIIEMNGERVGIIGATTQLLANISSPGLTTGLAGSSDNMPALAAVLQPVIDSLRAMGINKIILMSHLQQLANEKALAPLLKGVDIIIAGGSHSLCADGNDRLRAGIAVADRYPILTVNYDNEPLAILNTTSEWKYIGRFVCDFDSVGRLIPNLLDSTINGAYAADTAMVTSLYGTYAAGFITGSKGANVRTLTSAIATVINAKDGNKFGKTNVFLEGRRNFVRTEETNFGNLTADANLWYAREYDNQVRVSIKNGGGIRSAIGNVNAVGSNVILENTLANPSAGKVKGDISQLDIENSLRFNNGLVIARTNAAGLKRLIEHGISATISNATPGQFPQVGGVMFSYDTTKTAGNRIQSFVITDSTGNRLDTIVRNGLLVGDTTRIFKFVTLDFLYSGGDNYPFAANANNRVNLDTALKAAGIATFTTIGKEQDAFAEYMATFHSSNAYSIRDTTLKGDRRIQLLNARMDGVIVPNAGPSSSQSAYLLPTSPGVQFTSIISVGDNVGGYKMAGIPDGAGAYDNGNGTFTMLVAHELNNALGVTRAHGGKGAFVSKWVINKNDLSVVSGADLIQKVQLYTATIGYTLFNPADTTPRKSFNRFCSADLPAVSAFYNAASGLGTPERIFMNGEEAGAEGRAFGHIVTGTNAGTTWELPSLGKFSWENSVAHPSTGNKTVVVGTDDASPGQVYFYIGDKTNTGSEVDRAGLTNGRLYGVAVTGLTTEVSASFPAANTAFTLVDLGNVKDSSGAALNTRSNALGITNFLRPEDAAWDPSNYNDLYFVTTNGFNSPSRMWRLRFTNINNPSLGGTITAVLDGTEGQQMMDNIGIDKSGHILIQEDPGNNVHIAKIWQYTIGTDKLELAGQHDPSRFVLGGANYLTQDEESSGIIDVQDILGAGNFLLVDQTHYSIPGELVEGGQILKMFNPASANGKQIISIAAARALTTDTVRVRGVVTRVWGRFIYMQDATGAIAVRQSSGAMVDSILSAGIKEGDSIEVVGGRGNFNNYAQINIGTGAYGENSRVTKMSSNATIPAPSIVTVKEINTNGEQYESKVLRIVGLRTNATAATFPASSNNTIWDGATPGDTTILRIISAQDTEIEDAPALAIPKGAFIFEGILAQFCSSPAIGCTNGYQVYGVRKKDITEMPLTAFNLLNPANNAKVTTDSASATPFQINWSSSANAARYKWMLTTEAGNFTSPLLSLSSNNAGVDSILTLTSGAVDAILASLSLNKGDSVKTKWTVFAYKGVSDSLQALQVFNLTLARSKPVLPVLGSFNLNAPVNNARVVVEEANTSLVNINWTKSAHAINYRWFATTATGSFANPLLRVSSNNAGVDSVLTLTSGAIDAILNGLTIKRTDSITLKWTVYAYLSATDSLKAGQDWNVKLVRNRILGAFNLTSPANNARVEVEESNTAPIVITWLASAKANKYKWKATTMAGNFITPLLNLNADNAGNDAKLTLTSGGIDAILASNGIIKGDSITLKWTVFASETTDSLQAVETFNIKLVRKMGVGVNEVNFANHISVYPNPSQSIITIETKQLKGKLNIKLYSISGKLLLDERNLNATDINKFDVSEFNDGTYLLSIEDENGRSAHVKVVVIK